MSLVDPPKLEDVDMPDVKPKPEEDAQVDAEMDDLFGNDDDLDEAKAASPGPTSDALPQAPPRCVFYHIFLGTVGQC